MISKNELVLLYTGAVLASPSQNDRAVDIAIKTVADLVEKGVFAAIDNEEKLARETEENAIIAQQNNIIGELRKVIAASDTEIKRLKSELSQGRNPSHTNDTVITERTAHDGQS